MSDFCRHLLLKNRRCIHSIDRNYHPFCGVVSLMLAEELDGVEGLQRKRIFRKFKLRIGKISREARFICQRAGVPFVNGVCIDSFRKILELTPYCDHPLVIFSSKSYMTAILKCNLDAPGSIIYLLLDNNNHFGVISSINTFLGKPGVFCPKCEKFFTGNSTRHMCDRKLCKQCKSHCGNHNVSDSDKIVPNIVCDKCRRGLGVRSVSMPISCEGVLLSCQVLVPYAVLSSLASNVIGICKPRTVSLPVETRTIPRPYTSVSTTSVALVEKW